MDNNNIPPAYTGPVVDGENTGEVMNPGYNDANGPTDGGGDIIDGADGNSEAILGNGGDDTINAGAGDDLVAGGSGDDVIDGGSGNDTIFGDTGPAVSGGAPVEIGIADEGGVATLLVWDASQLSYTGGDPFPDGTGGLSDSSVRGITMTINPGALPVAVGIHDGSSSHFNDGDTTQDLVNNETIDGESGRAGDRFTPEYSYSVQNVDTGQIINVYAVELNGNEIVGFVSDAPMEVGATYSFLDNTSTHPSVPYGDLADTYFGPDTSGGPGDSGGSDGNGDDTIDGGAGNDLIYGDSGAHVEPVSGNPTTLDISDLSGGRIVSEDGSLTADVSLGGFIQTTSSSTFGKATPDNVFYSGPEVGGSRNTLDLDFDTPVSNVSFTIFDVNAGGGWDDQVRIIALDADGNQLPVTFSGTNVNNGGVDVRGNTIDANDNNTTFRLDASNPDNVQVNIAGPIASLQVIHEPGNDTSHVIGFIGVGDIDVTPILDAGGPGGTPSSDDGGNDVIDGGDGEDTIFGQGGDDTIDGGADDDLIYGDNGVPVEPVSGNPTTLDISDLSGGRIVSEDGSLTADVSLGGFIQTTSSSTFGKATPDNVFYSGPEVGGSRNTLDLDFDTPVSDVSFTIFDVNSGGGWDDQVRIIALDADGNQLPVTFSGTNVNTGGVDVRGNTIDANDNNTTFRLDASNPDNVQVNIAGPIASLQVIHEPGNDTSNVIGFIGVGDIDVTPILDAGGPGGTPSSDDDGDDVIDGGTGEDTIFGEGGNDTIDGGSGDDLIYGDNNEDLTGAGSFTGPRESFNWDLVNSSQADSSVVQDTGDVNVTYTRITDTGSHESDIDNSTPLNTAGIDSGSESIDTNSSLESITNGNGNEGAFQWQFDEPVGNVEFNINDLDGDGVVTITAFGPDGVTQIPVELVGGSDIDVNGNTATAVGPYQEDNDPDITVQVTIPGPVSRIVVAHEQDGSDNSGVHITDMYFDTGFVPGTEGQNGEGGDDVITGGEGADTMFGEGGDDTFIVGSAAEGAGDVIDGGNGPDETTDTDVLDLRGAGDVTIDEAADANDAGATAGTVTFEDGSTLTFEGIEEILTDPDNAAPVANDDDIVVPEDGSVTFDPTANDSDPDGDPVTVDSFTQPANGTVTQNPDGTLTYTPDPEYNGPDSFEVTVTDPEGLTSTSTVDVDVTPVNDAPVAADDVAQTDEDTPVVIDVLQNDTDPDGDPVTVDSFTQPANGTVTQNPDGTLTYTPDPNFNGADSFEVTVTDPDGLTSTSTVDVNVASVDELTAVDDTATTEEDTPVTIDVVANDENPDGGVPTIIDATVPADQGTVEIVGNQLVFTPAPDFNGDATITYTIEDEDGLTDTATAIVDVTPANDAPEAVDDSATTQEDTPVTINVLANDSDPENDPLTVVDASVPADQGTVAIIGNQVVFTPAEDFSGDATITYTIEDDEGLQDTAEVEVTVTPVEDAPDAVDDVATTPEDTPVTINVLANDSDPENDPLTVVDASVPADQGTVAIIGNQVVFTPAEDFNGEATITYTIEDDEGLQDTAEVVVTVTPVEDAPEAVDDAITTAEDTPITFDPTNNDSDPDGDDVTVSEVTQPDNGTVEINPDGTITYTPDPDFAGEDTFEVTVTDPDGNEDTSTVTVSVSDEPDAPVTNPDTAETDEDTPVTIDPLANDTDPDGQPLTVGEATSPDGTVEINPDGTITFTPDPDFNGPTTIDYTAVDPDGNETPGTITVTVAPVNDAPDAVNDTEETDEETPVTIDVLGNDTDVDGDPLTITGASVPADQGTVDVVGNALVFTPAEDFTGVATISYSIEDGNGGTDTAIVEVTVNNVNDAPVATDDLAETDEDTPVTIDVLGNDTDPDGDPLTITDVSVPADQGSVVDNGDGTVTFTPAPDFNGPATITYTVSDGQGGEDEGEVTVSVGSVNDGPIATDDVAETDEDTPVTIDVLDNDSDPDSDPLTIVGASVPADEGVVEVVGNQLVFTPAEDFNGEATITYTITDGNGGTDTADVVVTVNPVNDAPVVTDEIETTDEDVPITIDLLANDTDPDGDPLSLGDVSVPPEVGTVVDNGDGTVTFTPAPDYNGPAVISYTVVDDQGGETPGEAVVSVGAVNDAPVAEDDSDTTPEDTPITVDLLANDSDPDGDTLTVISATVPADQGSVVDNGDGTVTFTPAPDFNGEAVITYTVSDGNGGTATAEHVVTVTDEPDAPVTNPDTAETDEDTPVTIDPLANDTDPDGQPLTVGEATSPDGTVEINPDGTITFTPDPDFNGPTTIDYTAVDPDGNETPGTITVTVAPVNDAPDAVNDTEETDEETPVTIDVLGNDTDVDGDPLTITGASVPADQGTVDVVGNALVFTPAEDFTGVATISYSIEDGNGGTDTAIVEVTVNNVNDAPVATDDLAETDEDTPVTIDVLGNDTDPDGDPLTITDVSVPADQGSVVDNGDGTVTFTPAPDFNGPATITYTVSDGQGGEDEGEVTVSVGSVNDGPIATDDVAETDEDTPVTIDVLDNDSDPDSDPLTIVGASVPADEGVVEVVGNQLVFTPAEDFNGEATITYTITDGNGGTDTADVVVTVNPVNDAPVVTDEIETTDEDVPITIDLLANDTDPDGDPLSLGDVSVPPEVGTVVDNGDGTVTFTPAPDYNGPAVISYTVVDDQGGETPGEAVVSVGAVNDAPVAEDDSDTTPEDTPITVDLLANDSDPDGDTLTVISATVPADQGSVVDNGDGTVTFTPAPDFNGEAVITYTVSDGNGGTATAEHVVTVTDEPDAPVTNPDTAETDEDTPVTIDPLANDTDPDGQPLTVGEATSPDGTVEINPDGTITFTPDPDFNGPTTIDYTAVDPDGNETPGTITVTVAPVNDAPDAVNDTEETDEETPVTIDVLGNDTDVDGDPLTITGASVPADQGTVDVVGNALVFTPAEDFTGVATISYSIEDGNGGTDTAIVEVTVNNVNDAPVATDDLAETDEDTPVTIDVLGNDTDPDGDPLTITDVSVPADQGSVVDNGDGTVTFTPAPDFNGPATITYTVSDGQGGEDEGEVTVSVGSVNDGPIATDDVAETDEDTPVTIDVLDNDSDPDSDPLTIVGASVPADEGVVEVVGNQLVFTPAEDFNGEATITYTITDGNGGTDTADVVVTVNPVNDAPVVTDEIETTDEDVPITIDLLANDTDPDGDPLSLGDVSVPPEVGTVVDNGDGTVTFTPAPDYNGPAVISYTVVDDQGGETPGEAVVSVGAVNDAPVAEDDSDTTPEDTPITVDLLANDSDPDGDTLTVISATVPADQGSVVDNGDGTVTFTPAPDFNGEAVITYTVSDGNGGTATAEHVVTVTDEPDAPVTNPDTAETDEDTPVTIDPLANDTDPDGQPLTVGEATSPDGTVEINPDGTITFTPDPDFNGPTTIDYTAVDPDGNETPGTITVTVAPVNDAPDAVNDTEETDEETPVTIDVLGNDTDVDGDPLTITGASVPADQGTVDVVGNALVFTPAEDFTGVATISYSIEDGNGGTDTAIVEVTVNNVNDAPVATDDLAETDEDTPVTIDVLGNDTDPDGDPLTITDVSVPADQGSVVDNGDGTVTFTPAPDFNGPATITYTVSDGQGGEDEGEVTVSVGSVNDGPIATDDVAETDEDTPVTIDVLDNDSDPDSDPLTIVGASVPADEGVVEVVGNQLVFTPAEDFNGEATITYTITDGNGGTDTADVVVTVNPVNDAPVVTDEIETTDEDVPITIDLLANDTDPDGDPLSLGDVSVPPEVGTVVDNGDGTVTFTPAPDYNGPAVISYTVVDDQGGETPGEAVVSVGAVNDAPVAEDDSDTTPEDTPITVDLLANDSDPDGDTLTVISATVPADQGSVVDNGDGTVTFTPAPDFNGEAVITYTVSDGNGGTATAEHVVTVTDEPDAPVTNPDTAETDEDTPVTIDPLANDTDPDGQPLTVGEATSPDGTVEINPDGTITFTPDPDFNGPTTIDYTAVDPDGNETPGTITVTVAPVNDAPEPVADDIETDEDTPITFDPTENDEDPDGDPLEVVDFTQPDNGTVTQNPDGTLTYTPDPDFNGTDTFEVTVTDPDGVEVTSPVTVSVAPVNDAPVAEDDVASTPFDTPVVIDVLANDEDPDGDSLEVVAAESPDGAVVINPDGTLSFTPNDGFEGPATITYTIEDPDGLQDEGTVTVNVGDNPRDGIVEGDDTDNLIDENYDEDPEGDMVDAEDAIDPNAEPNDDVIEAGGGNDTVLAGEGDDVVDGGTGEDDIDGGEGDDLLDGGDDDDTITGGEGNDTVLGGEGDDVIDTDNGELRPDIGFPGLPPVLGPFPADTDPENDRDSVDGGAGDDTIRTGDDRDTITGGDGDDDINAGIDDDEVDGGDGADRIVGGEGNDIIEAGEGDDTIYAGNDPDLGLDLLDIEDDGSNPLGADPVPDNGKDTVFGGAGNDVIFGADDGDELFGEDGNDTIDGEIDDDLIDGGDGEDSLIGGQGNDTLLGGEDDDILEGGIGDDSLDGGDDDDTLEGGEGRDTLEGGDGDDLLDGGFNADTLQGGFGNDTLIGGNGADLLEGDEGDDLLQGGTGDDTLDGGAGDDTLEGGTGDDLLIGGEGDDSIDGGNGGEDTIEGGDGRDTIFNVDAGETVDGGAGPIDEDFDTLDLRGSIPLGGSLAVTITGPDSNGNGSDGFVTYFDADGNETGVLNFTEIEEVIPCFTPGTMIATPRGEIRVEELEVGDQVITRDNGIQAIRWVGRRDMTSDEFAAQPQFRPVLIRRGALGNGLPERDMMVSPNHRVLLASDQAELLFEEREVLVAAKHLVGVPGIEIAEVHEATYIHIMFDQHEVILSDGAWTESFQPGDNSLAGVDKAQREELLALFPELETQAGIEAYSAARRILKKHEAHLLRH